MATYIVPQDGVGMTQYVDRPNWAHVLVTEIQDAPLNGNGEIMNAIRVRGKVLASTDASQKGHEFSELLNNPNMSHKDGGAFAAKCHLRLAIALRMIAMPAPGQGVDINWALGRGRQMVCKFDFKKDQDKKITERVGFDGGHFYDVQDPEVSAYPKDQAALLQFGVPAASAPAGQVRQAAPVQQPQYAQQQVAAAASSTQWDNI